MIEITHNDVVKHENRKYFINNKKVSSRETVAFNCKNCKRFHSVKIFRFNDFLCSSCKRKYKNVEEYGVEYPLQSSEIKSKLKQTKLKKYGDENYNNRDKYKQTCLERYNTKYPFLFGSKEFNKLIKEKYNVENISQLEEIKIKKRKTNLEYYGVDHNFKRNDIKEKIKENRRRNFYNRLLNSDRLKNKVKPLFPINEYKGVEYRYQWQCTKCGSQFEDHICDGHIPRCSACYPPLIGTSCYEEEIYNWLQSLNIQNIILNTKKIIQPYELDLYLPDYKLAIEFNGLYWHSELQGKDKHYHLNKTELCNKKGIQLIHIFEDEWLNKQDIIKSIIEGRLGLHKKLYARKCEVREINNQPDFLDNNHLQGSVNSKINIGLYYNNELISLLSLSKPRYNKKYNWEILRFANKLSISITGGFSRLIKYFQNKYNGSIITYSDKRYFDGSIYKNNGFEELDVSKPNYYYTDYKQRFNRVGFQKHKLEEQLDIFDSNLTEWENMQLNGYDRIWDCGNNIFVII